MLLVPLFLPDPPGGPDASHRICAPGGYEFWQLRATDKTSNIELTLGFFDGHPSLHAYLRRYRQYLRKPTTIAPPTPRDFPVVEIQVIAPYGRKFTDVQVLRPGSLQASIDRLDLSAGAHTLRRKPDRSIELHMEHRNGQGDLIFRPRSDTPPARVVHEEGEYVFNSDPSCTVTGTIHLKPPAPLEPRTIQFDGEGSLEHRWRPDRDDLD